MEKKARDKVAAGDIAAGYRTGSEAETAGIAARLAARLKPGDVVLLSGDLGAGKTVFARALIRALAGDAGLTVPSPTFTLVQTYDTPAGTVWHFDLYRTENPAEIYELGWEEALYDGITIVEWPQKLGKLAPGDYLGVSLETLAADAQQRLVTLAPAGSWKDRMDEL